MAAIRVSMDNVMTRTTKEIMITVRLRPQTREEFRAAMELRDQSMSQYLRPFINSVIREEKERDPQAFAETLESLKNSGKARANKKGKGAFSVRQTEVSNLPFLGKANVSHKITNGKKKKV